MTDVPQYTPPGCCCCYEAREYRLETLVPHALRRAGAVTKSGHIGRWVWSSSHIRASGDRTHKDKV
ncbi:hypothetical protein BD309DRAFT_948984 [Dichomitus squalens]|nr:hypothetical protein BD309DRAFT_948984 [Dichomitus squalens]